MAKVGINREIGHLTEIADCRETCSLYQYKRIQEIIHIIYNVKVVKEQLGFLAYDTDELKTILMNGFNVSQDDYTLPKLSQSKIKKLEKQYMNS